MFDRLTESKNKLDYSWKMAIEETQKTAEQWKNQIQNEIGEKIKVCFCVCSFWTRSTKPNRIEMILPKPMRPQQAENGEND